MNMILWLIGVCVGVGLGWWLKSASVARKASSRPITPPPAIIYEQGYRAGWYARVPAAASPTPAPVPAAAPAPAPTPTPTPTPATSPAVRPAAVSPQISASSNGVSRPSAPLFSPGSPPWNDGKPQGKASTDLRNINITLFTASLLLIAATALFISADFSGAVRLIVVTLVAALFYGAGLQINRKLPRLRAAGLAFTGAGLAMIPFVGIALNALALNHLGWSWLITAVTGAVAFIFAAVRLESRVVAYLSLPFLLSIVWAPGNVLGAALVWYFAATITVAAGLTLMAKFRPEWAGNLYLQTISKVHRFIVPGVLMVSLLLVFPLEPLDFVLITGAACLYYGTALFVRTDIVLNVYGLRIAMCLLAFSATVASGASVSTALYVAAGVAGVQALAVAFLPRRFTVRFSSWQVRDAVCTYGTALLGAVVGLVLMTASGTSAASVLVLVIVAQAVAMTLAGRIRGAAEFLPVAALVLVFGLPWSELWCFEVVLGVFLVYVLVRLMISTHGSRERFVYLLSGRGLLVLAAGLVVLAHWPSGKELAAGPIAVLAMIVAILLNQMWSLQHALRGRSVGSPTTVILCCAGLVYLASLSLWVSPVSAETIIAALWLSLAGTAVPAILLFQRVPWLEAIIPAPFLATALLGIPHFSLHDYELLLVATVGAALLMAVHHGSGARRSAYSAVAGGFTAATAAVVVLGHVQELMVAEHASMAVLTFSVGVFINQAVLWAQAGRSANALVAARAQVGFALAAAGSAGALAVMDGPRWMALSALWLLLLGTVAVGVLLFQRFRWMEYVSGMAFPVTAVIAFPVFGTLEYQILIGAALVYAAVMTVRHQAPDLKGMYFLAGQLLLTLLVGVTLWEREVSIHMFFTALSVSLLTQEVLRAVFRRLVQELSYQRASYWLTVLLLVGIHPVYIAGAGSASQRGVLVAALISLAAVFLVQSLWGRARTGYLAVACVPFLIALFSEAFPVGNSGWLGHADLSFAALTVLTLGVGALAFGLTRTRRYGPAQTLASVAVVSVFLLEGLGFALAAGGWARAAALILIASFVFVESHTWDAPRLYALGTATVIGASWMAGMELKQVTDLAWGYRELQLAAHVGAAGVVYAWLMIAGPRRLGRARYLSGALPALISLTVAAIMAMTGGQGVVPGSLFLVVTAVLWASLAPTGQRALAGELVFLTCLLAAERIWLHAHWDASLFWLAQAWVVVVALIALYEEFGERTRAARAWMVGAACLLSATAPLAIFTSDAGHQVWSLLGHTALLLYGVVRQSRIFTWWGAAGLAIAVLWFLKGYTFVLLVLVAAGLIGFAIWRLNQNRDSKDLPN